MSCSKYSSLLSNPPSDVSYSIPNNSKGHTSLTHQCNVPTQPDSSMRAYQIISKYSMFFIYLDIEPQFIKPWFTVTYTILIYSLLKIYSITTKHLFNLPCNLTTSKMYGNSVMYCVQCLLFIGSFPLQNEPTSEVYVGDFGLHNSRLHKCHHNRTPCNTK